MIEVVILYAAQNNLLNRSRKREKVHRVRYLMAYLRKCGFSLSEIGKAFDRDHATALHHVNAHNVEYEKYEDYMAAIQDELHAFPIECASFKLKLNDYVAFKSDNSMAMFKELATFDKLINK